MSNLKVLEKKIVVFPDPGFVKSASPIRRHVHQLEATIFSHFRNYEKAKLSAMSLSGCLVGRRRVSPLGNFSGL
jgi:hypothetical protein